MIMLKYQKQNKRMGNKIWNFDSLITNKITFNSFKYFGFSCLLNRIEVDKFRGFEDLENVVRF